MSNSQVFAAMAVVFALQSIESHDGFLRVLAALALVLMVLAASSERRDRP